MGGKISPDARWQPTGVFIDNASDVRERREPAPTAAEYTSALKDAIALMHRWGLTGMHDAGATRGAIERYEALAKANELNLRLYVMIGDDAAALDHYFAKGPQSALSNGQLWVRAVKLYARCAMGSPRPAPVAPCRLVPC